jgi:hypothetical protein
MINQSNYLILTLLLIWSIIATILLIVKRKPKNYNASSLDKLDLWIKSRKTSKLKSISVQKTNNNSKVLFIKKREVNRCWNQLH